MPILILIIIVAAVIFFIFSQSKKEGGGNWVQFISKGKEVGFSFADIETLRHLAIQSGLEDPISLFTSRDQLDKCIYVMVHRLKTGGSDIDENEIHDFLSRLYDYRQKIEVNKPSSKKNVLYTSHQLNEGQPLRILVSGTGVFKSQVVRNNGQYMTITRPVNNKIINKMPWEGTKISVYFWREDDAGYVFDSIVEDEVFSAGIASLKIAHSDTLFRTQKRKSVRIKMRKAAYLYLLGEHEHPHRLEAKPGLKCVLEDLSDTGCAVAVGGKAGAGQRVKVQFALDNIAICMTGTVRSVSYNELRNRSTLHIEAESLPIDMRNHIFGEVFGMFGAEGEEELPFRVIDEPSVKSDDIISAALAEEQTVSNVLLGDDFFSDMPDDQEKDNF